MFCGGVLGRKDSVVPGCACCAPAVLDLPMYVVSHVSQ